MAEPSAPVQRYDFDRVIRILFSAGLLVAFLWLVRYLADVLVPLAVAILIAYLLNPLVTLLDRRFNNRTASVAVVLLGLALLVFTLVLIMVPVTVRQVHDFTGLISAVIDGPETEAPTSQAVSFRGQYDAFKAGLPVEVKGLLTDAEQLVRDVEWDQVLLNAGRKIVPGLWGALIGFVSLIVGIVGLMVVFVYVVFLLIDFPEYAGHWREFLPPAYRSNIEEFIDEFALAMSRYFRGQFIIAFLTGACYVIGFWLIGLRLAVPLGLLIGALCMVPYLQVVGLLPALFLAVIRAIERQPPDGSPNVMWSIILVLMIFGIVQLIQDWVLTPRIMGQTTGLRPVVMLVGLFIWGKLLGFLGVVLAIPLTCIGIVYYRKFVLGRSAGRTLSTAIV